MEMGDEVVCSVKHSYLILCKPKARKPQSPLIREQQVLFFHHSDRDEISTLAQRGPYLSPKSGLPYRFLCIQSKPVIVQEVRNRDSKAEWSKHVSVILQSCESVRIRQIAILRPSESLEQGLATIGVQLLVDALVHSEVCVHIRLISANSKYSKLVYQSLGWLGVCAPQGSPPFKEQSLLTSIATVTRCHACKFFPIGPTLSNGAIYCSLCSPERATQLSPADGVLLNAVAQIPVTCRCGVTTNRRALEDHVLECPKKEWFCSSHQFGGSADDIVKHLVDDHLDYVLKGLGKLYGKVE